MGIANTSNANPTFGLQINSTNSTANPKVNPLNIPEPPVININYTYIAVGILILLFIIILIFKARWKLVNCCTKVRVLLQNKFQNLAQRKRATIQQRRVIDYNDTGQSYFDELTCDSLDYTEYQSQLEDVLYSRPCSLELPFFIDDNNNTTNNNSDIVTSYSTISCQENITLERNADAEAPQLFSTGDEPPIQQQPPFVERAMRISKQFKRRLLPTFLSINHHHKSIANSSRRSSKYFHDESQIYNLDSSEKETTNSGSIISDIVDPIEMLKIDIPNGHLSSIYFIQEDETLIPIQYTPHLLTLSRQNSAKRISK